MSNWTGGLVIMSLMWVADRVDDRTHRLISLFTTLPLTLLVVFHFLPAFFPYFLFLISVVSPRLFLFLTLCARLLVLSEGIVSLFSFFLASVSKHTPCFFCVFTARVKDGSKRIEPCWEGAPPRWRCPRRERQSGAGCRPPSATQAPPAAAAPRWWRRPDRPAPSPPTCVSAGWETWGTQTRDICSVWEQYWTASTPQCSVHYFVTQDISLIYISVPL